jgi:DNA topoisomerase-1
LFEYVDDSGKIKPVTPRDVNDYIKAMAGPEFSAKDFRTWGGSLLAAIRLAEVGQAENERQLKRNIVQAVKQVAEHLGNTPTVCRNCYIHPLVIERYTQGVTLEAFRPKRSRRIRRLQPEYEPEEMALLKLFRANGKAARTTERQAA